MTFERPAKTLGKMYNNAPYGEQMTFLTIFGIKYADEISSMSLKDMVKVAGLSPSYATEVSKGIKLAKYVELK